MPPTQRACGRVGEGAGGGKVPPGIEPHLSVEAVGGAPAPAGVGHSAERQAQRLREDTHLTQQAC